MRAIHRALVLLPGLAYALTRARGLTFIDSGELAATATTLGVAHPTGYPLFTLIGRLLAALPGPGDPISRLTLFSALAIVAGLYTVRGAFATLTHRLGRDRRTSEWAATAATLLLGSGITVWSQAVIIEVYALAFLALCVLIRLSLATGADEAHATPELTVAAAESTRRRGALFAFAAGIALTCHGSLAPLAPLLATPLLWRLGVPTVRALAATISGALAVVLLPASTAVGGALAIAALVVAIFEPHLRRLARTLASWVALAALGLSVYAYLPLRSRLEPLLDWGATDSTEAFIRHITGKVFQVWYLSSVDAVITQLGRFASLALAEWTLVGLVLVVWGAVRLAMLDRPTLLITALVVVVNVLHASSYEIFDIAPYYLPSLIVFALWSALGLAEIGALLARRAPAWLVIAILVAVPFAVAARNAPITDQSRSHWVADYTESMFAGLEKEAIVVSRQWDFFCSAALYEQAVRGVRADVTVIEKELMRRTWYLEQLERWDPALVQSCASEMAELSGQLTLFESEQPYDPRAIQAAYVGAIQCLIERATDAGRPTYITKDALEPGIGAGYRLAPVGLAFRLEREHGQEPSLPPNVAPAVRELDRAARSDERLVQQLANLTLEMMADRALAELRAGHIVEARAGVEATLTIDPDHTRANELARMLERLDVGGEGERLDDTGEGERPDTGERPGEGDAGGNP